MGYKGVSHYWWIHDLHNENIIPATENLLVATKYVFDH